MYLVLISSNPFGTFRSNLYYFKFTFRFNFFFLHILLSDLIGVQTYSTSKQLMSVILCLGWLINLFICNTQRSHHVKEFVAMFHYFRWVSIFDIQIYTIHASYQLKIKISHGPNAKTRRLVSKVFKKTQLVFCIGKPFICSKTT